MQRVAAAMLVTLSALAGAAWWAGERASPPPARSAPGVALAADLAPAAPSPDAPARAVRPILCT